MFHPVRAPGSAIRLHPLTTGLLDADFDGDQVAVFLPLTEDGQREAGERLTVAAHLARDPSLIETLLPPPEAVWGLAYLGLDEAGLDRLIKAGYELLGLQTYFTAGEKEVRAWTVRNGAKAPEAAEALGALGDPQAIRPLLALFDLFY